MGLIKKASGPKEILEDLFEVASQILRVPIDVHNKRVRGLKRIKRSYTEDDSFQRFAMKRDLRRLKDRKLVNFKELSNGDVRIFLTEIGRKKASMLKIKSIKIKEKKPKDGFKRLVIFDVPVGRDRIRDIFRSKLRDLGFEKIQHSVFITSFDCEKEIKEIANILGIEKSVKILKVV